MEQIYRNFNILLVEDNPGDVRTLIRLFHEASFQPNFIVVDNGNDALEYLYRRGHYKKSVLPDLIILDLGLPGKSGEEILQDIKNHLLLRQIPVIILSANEKAIEDINIKNYKVNSYITKPFDKELLADILDILKDYWASYVELRKAG